MGWFDFLSPKSAEKVIDVAGDSVKGIGRWIDNAHYTDQEKAAATAKVIDNYLKHQELVLNETSPRSLSRRYIALIVVINTLIAMWVCVGLAIWANPLTLPAVLQVLAAFKIGWAFCTVIVFYFGAHLIGYLGGKSK